MIVGQDTSPAEPRATGQRGLEPPVYGSRQPRSTLLGPLSRYLRERVAAFSELSAGRDRRWLPP